MLAPPINLCKYSTEFVKFKNFHSPVPKKLSAAVAVDVNCAKCKQKH